MIVLSPDSLNSKRVMSEEQPKVKIIKEGVFFEAGGKRLGPYSLSDLDQVDFKSKIASMLSIEPKEILKAELRELQRPITIEELQEILGTTIKHDNPTKTIIFLNNLLTYTEEDQGNIALQSESSTGKSYIPLEIIEYFPDQEIKIYGGASPTSFFHEAGILVDENNIPIDFSKKPKKDAPLEERDAWKKKIQNSRILVDLEKKILIFLDQPHYMLLEKLRPLLSHDRKELEYNITDKSEKHGLRTKKVRIRGYPTVIFCAAKFNMDEQEKTRVWLLSPETTEDKITESLYLLAKKLGNRDAFKEELENDCRRIWLKRRIKMIKDAGIRNIIIENPDALCKRFIETHNHLIPRHQRDFPKLFSLIKAHALLNWAHREQLPNNCIKANNEDIEAGFKLYNSIATPNELGISPRIWEIYEQVMKPLFRVKNPEGLDKKDILKAHKEKFHRPLSYESLRKEIIPTLEGAGLIYQEPDPNDKRRILIYPTDVSPIFERDRQTKPFDEKYREQVSGINKNEEKPITTSQSNEWTNKSKRDFVVSWLRKLNHWPSEAEIKTFYETNQNGLGSFDSFRIIFDELKNRSVCGKCAHYKTEECIMKEPNLISPTATYALDCEAFKPKEV